MPRYFVPAMRQPFWVDEWLWSEQMATSRGRRASIAAMRSGPSGRCEVRLRRARSRAATMTVTMASEAEPWMTPPPPEAEVERKLGGSESSLHSQSRTMVSSSVAAGEQSQLKLAEVKAAEYRSPRMPGYVEFAGKKARKLGCCLTNSVSM